VTPEVLTRWLNFNSFAARMNSEGLIEGNMYAIYYLRTALEELNFGSTLGDTMVINSNISVASEWIIR
jgi:Protein of unknown function (DUF3632)